MVIDEDERGCALLEHCSNQIACAREMVVVERKNQVCFCNALCGFIGLLIGNEALLVSIYPMQKIGCRVGKKSSGFFAYATQEMVHG